MERIALGFRVCGVLTLCVLLLACGSPRRSTVTPEPGVAPSAGAVSWPAPVDANATLSVAQQPSALEVGVVVFDAGLTNPDTLDARDTLRSVETRLAAALLRDALTESQAWGPVRVLPSPSHFAALTVTGEIVHSDGRDLVLRVHAVDATGAEWIDATFRARAEAADYDESSGRDPYWPLFAEIANQLQQRLADFGESVGRINDVAQMRYAAELAPAAFGSYVREQDGRWLLNRLPAEADPMLARIERIRNQEALFIDTVDQHYVDLREQLGASYRLWRRSSAEQAEYLERYTDRASARDVRAPAGSFAAMQQVYSTYRSVRIQEQDLFELATGFDNETEATVLDSGNQVVRLTGTLSEQYQQWRQILARIVELERGTLQ